MNVYPCSTIPAFRRRVTVQRDAGSTDTSGWGFSWFCSVPTYNTGRVPPLGHNRFLPCPYWFIYRPTLRRCMPKAWLWQKRKIITGKHKKVVGTTHIESSASNQPMLGNGWLLPCDWLALDSLWVVPTRCYTDYSYFGKCWRCHWQWGFSLLFVFYS
jgi:hypothetical protein